MSAARKCATCVHCAVIDAECRANPATVFFIPTSQGPRAIGAWPPVQPHQWCGRYERAPDEEIEGRTAELTKAVEGAKASSPVKLVT